MGAGSDPGGGGGVSWRSDGTFPSTEKVNRAKLARQNVPETTRERF